MLEDTEMSSGSSKKVNKCHHYCSVPGCKTSQFKEHKMSFHTFPKEGESQVIIDDLGCDEVLDRREAWCRRTFLGKSYGREITGATYVCSRHFQLSDFCSQEKTKKRCRRLKKAAVPSLNLPSPDFLSSSNSEKQKILHLKFRSPFPLLEPTPAQVPPSMPVTVTQVVPQPETEVYDPLTPRRPDQGARSLLEMFEDPGNQPAWEIPSTSNGTTTLSDVLDKLSEDSNSPL